MFLRISVKRCLASQIPPDPTVFLNHNHNNHNEPTHTNPSGDHLVRDITSYLLTFFLRVL
jgi:hypothetical protein